MKIFMVNSMWLKTIKTNMKKIITFVPAGFVTMGVNAQDNYPRIDGEVFRICATIFVVLAFMVFILAVLKGIFEYRLKRKIVDKGIPENIISSLLKDKGEGRNINIKWFAILAGLGAGLMIVNYTLPLGIHSLAIMTFSIAFSFLGYYFYLKRSGN
jgi:hypothetical protein